MMSNSKAITPIKKPCHAKPAILGLEINNYKITPKEDDPPVFQ